MFIDRYHYYNIKSRTFRIHIFDINLKHYTVLPSPVTPKPISPPKEVVQPPQEPIPVAPIVPPTAKPTAKLSEDHETQQQYPAEQQPQLPQTWCQFLLSILCPSSTIMAMVGLFAVILLFIAVCLRYSEFYEEQRGRTRFNRFGAAGAAGGFGVAGRYENYKRDDIYL